MSIVYADPWLTVHQGDARAVLPTLPEASVDCIVTSPPYWGLRDYGVDGQIGLERTPDEYVANLVAVFREARRALRDDGTLWLNLGDCYVAGAGRVGTEPGGGAQGERRGARNGHEGKHRYGPDGGVVPMTQPNRLPLPGLKPKDLVGIPWRVAFALQADGWYLRADVIWSKTNPMPESVRDRPTNSHEYVFLLSKSARYYYDAEAVREPIADGTKERFRYTHQYATRAHRAGAIPISGGIRPDAIEAPPVARNVRSVWTIATQPYPGAHFATFPPKLVEPCVKAGTSERGVCPKCGAPWERVVERDIAKNGRDYEQATSGSYDIRMGPSVRATTTGWRPSCRHDAEPVPATVLDPFGGSGTTALVAERLGRRAILVDLSEDYIGQALERIAKGRREGTGAALDMDLPAPAGSLWDVA